MPATSTLRANVHSNGKSSSIITSDAKDLFSRAVAELQWK